MVFDRVQIEGVLHDYDAREVEIQRQLAYFQSQATTRRGRQIYATVKRALDREMKQMQVCRSLLTAYLPERETQDDGH